MGWEFPLSSLISLDIVDMVEKKVVSSGDPPFLHRSIYVPSEVVRLQLVSGLWLGPWAGMQYCCRLAVGCM